MIGIVKPVRDRKSCGKESRHQKMYCGTCKMIGERYGQPYRMGLNHDLVLAAEVLGMLGGDKSTVDGVRPRKCFAPLKLSGSDRSLFGYIAALHLFWYRVTLDDHCADENSRMAGFLRDRMASRADQAAADLAGYGLDMSLVDGYLARNRAIEQAMPAGSDITSGERAGAQGSAQSGPMRAAEPTARIIELVFRTGSDLCGIPEHKDAAGRFGYALGRAIYLHDACLDLKKDHKKGRFNPFLFSEKEAFVDGGSVSVMTAVRRTGVRCTAGCRTTSHRTEGRQSDRPVWTAELQQAAFRVAHQAWMDTAAALQALPVSDADRPEVTGRIHNTMSRLSRVQGMPAGLHSASVQQGLSVRGQDVAAPCLSAGACARPGVAAAQTAATTAALAALSVAAQAQSSDPTAGQICCSVLCCLFCCCPLFAFASEVAEGILQFICDILCCFSSYR